MGNSWQGTQWSQLVNIAMGREKQSDYLARLSSACHAHEIDMDAKKNPAYQPMLNAWFSKLPHTMQNTLKHSMKKVFEQGSIQDYMDLIKEEVPQEPGHVTKLVIHCPWCVRRN